MRTSSNPFTRGLFAIALTLFAGSDFSSALATPQQTALDLAGKSVDPLKSSPGKITVLLFVRSDCPISNRYAPLLQRLSDANAKHVKFWLVYPDKKATATIIRRHLEEFHYTISALRDPEHALVKLAQATITPEAAVFNSRGNLIYHGRIDNWYEDASRARPSATTHELQDALQAAIGGKPAPVASASAVGCYISDLE